MTWTLVMNVTTVVWTKSDLSLDSLRLWRCISHWSKIHLSKSTSLPHKRLFSCKNIHCSNTNDTPTIYHIIQFVNTWSYKTHLGRSDKSAQNVQSVFLNHISTCHGIQVIMGSILSAELFEFSSFHQTMHTSYRSQDKVCISSHRLQVK